MMETADSQQNLEVEQLIELPLEEKEKVSLEVIRSSLFEARNPYVFFSGGKRSLVLLHLIKRCALGRLNVLHAETITEFNEIINYIDKMSRLWALNLVKIKADSIDIDIASDQQECCRQLILDPLRRAVADHEIDCVYVGTASKDRRMDWSVMEKNGAQLVKPIFHFLDEDVWDYVKKYTLPHCSLYRKGYKNLDCLPCSRFDKDEKAYANKQDEAWIKESLRRLGYL